MSNIGMYCDECGEIKDAGECPVCDRGEQHKPTVYLTVDALAAEIRRVDGSHTLGAGALAEALLPFIQSHRVAP